MNVYTELFNFCKHKFIRCVEVTRHLYYLVLNQSVVHSILIPLHRLNQMTCNIPRSQSPQQHAFTNRQYYHTIFKYLRRRQLWITISSWRKTDRNGQYFRRKQGLFNFLAIYYQFSSG